MEPDEEAVIEKYQVNPHSISLNDFEAQYPDGTVRDWELLLDIFRNDALKRKDAKAR